MHDWIFLAQIIISTRSWIVDLINPFLCDTIDLCLTVFLTRSKASNETLEEAAGQLVRANCHSALDNEISY